VTPFGKRLLRKWLLRPLLNRSAIEERLDAIEDLERDILFRENIQKNLKALPDLERMTTRIY